MNQVKFFILLVLTLIIPCLSVSAQTGNLTSRQIKTLNRKLPLKVRNFLAAADKFQIIADTIMIDEKVYKPDMGFVIKNTIVRKKVLGSFYRDLALGGNGAACFYPHHTIIAEKGKETVRIDICFTCHEFLVSGVFGQWDGGFWFDPKSEAIFKQLITKYGTPIS